MASRVVVCNLVPSFSFSRCPYRDNVSLVSDQPLGNDPCARSRFVDRELIETWKDRSIFCRKNGARRESIVLPPREDRESLETSEISFDFGIERGEGDGASRESNCLFELVQWKSVYIGFYRILSAGL